MIKFILEILFLNSFEAMFLMFFILFIYDKKYSFGIKELIILIAIILLSNYIQVVGLPIGLKNFLGMFLYYIFFRLFYYKENRIKLIGTIILAFLILLGIQIIVYTPFIFFLNLNIQYIRHHLMYLLIVRVPIDILQLIILLILKERNDYIENR